MVVTLNKNILKKDAIKRIDSLIELANKINGKWEEDKLILDWDQKLQNEIGMLFKNKIKIKANLYSNGRYTNDLGLELKKIVIPIYYEEKREERSKNNEKVFLNQLSVLLKIIEELDKPSNFEKDIQTDKIEISISEINGISRILNNKELSYGISGRRRKIIFSLKDGIKTGNQLSEITSKDLTQTSKDIIDINRIFSKNLKLIDKKIIIRAKSHGYLLNEEFELKFI